MSFETLAIADGASYLAFRLDQPSAATDPELCVVYLHGFASQQNGQKADFFRDRFVGAGVAFCSFDFQGHGASGGSMLDLTLSRNLEDLGEIHDFLRARGYRKLVLFGSSMGGGSAMFFAARRPANVVAALLIAPALDLAAGLERKVGPVAFARWQETGRTLFAHELGAHELSWRLIEDLHTFERKELEKHYQTPTLIFQGLRDETVDWRGVVELVERCAHRRIKVELFADGGHRLVERLDELWTSAWAFLAARLAISP